MKRWLICCAVGVGLVFALAPTVVPTPASAYHYLATITLIATTATITIIGATIVTTIVIGDR